MALIYTLGAISGAHFNPAVTFAFAMRRDFPWRHVPGFWLAQLGGALLAAAFLRALFGLAGHLGITEPAAQLGAMPALWMEVVLTLLLILVILGTAQEHRVTGPNAALAVGATIALAGLFASPVSGASMNPARSLGPDIVALHLSSAWIYVMGPFAGAAIAVGLTWLLHGQPNHTEVETGSGQDNKRGQAQSRNAE
jgi:aquaporin Z